MRGASESPAVMKGDRFKGKSWVPWESTRDIYQHIPPIYELYNGCIRKYGVIFGEQLLGYPPKGTQNFPLIDLQ